MILRAYLAGAAGLVIAGQTATSQVATQGERLLDQAMNSDPTGALLAEAAKVSTLGVQPTDAAIIVAVSGLAWKFLDTQQKGGTVETLNLWLRRKLKVDDINPPPPPRA